MDFSVIAIALALLGYVLYAIYSTPGAKQAGPAKASAETTASDDPVAAYLAAAAAAASAVTEPSEVMELEAEAGQAAA